MNGRRALAAFAAGLLFAVGLVVGGMTVPGNVVGFLDFFGEWRPALAFVMAGAVGVYAALYPVVVRRRAPLFAPAFELPQAKGLDYRLLAGAAAFGVGWGLGGFCPGPALASVGAGAREAVVFVVAMAAGVFLHRCASGGEPDAAGREACG